MIIIKESSAKKFESFCKILQDTIEAGVISNNNDNNN